MTRPMTEFRNGARLVLLGLVLCLTMAGQAMAAIVVNSILVNGGSSANVSPGATITVTVSVTISGGTRWRSTAFTTSPSSSLSVCSLAPDLSASGTYVRTFTLSAPSGSGVYSLNVNAWTNPNCNGTSSATKVLPGGINTGPVTASLNHVRILHDGAALTCQPETITLRACANAACTTLFTDNVSVNLGAGAGTWSAANPVVISNGSRSLTLSNATAGTVTLSGTVSSPAAASTAAACYSGAANTCSLTFANTSCSLDSVETGKAANTPIYTKRIGGGSTITLDVLALTNGVINTSSTATIGAQIVQASGSGCSTTGLSNTVSVTLVGANLGRRSVTFTPTAASRNARVRLTSGSLVGCSSDNFAIRPSSFSITGSNYLNADPSGTSASATNLAPIIPAVLKADTQTFSLIAASAAAGYDGTPQIDTNMVAAHAGANAGGLSGTFGAAVSASGAASGTAFKYSEVGYFRLGAFGVYDDDFSAVDAGKSPAECFSDSALGTGVEAEDPNVAQTGGIIGCYFGSAQTAYFGRFVPDHFTVTPISVLNRSATATCSASTFTYMGEAMSATFTVEARNGNDDPTSNYTGDYARLVPASGVVPAASMDLGVVNAPASGTRTPFPDCSATPVHPCHTPGVIAGAFTDGSGDFTAPFTLYRGATGVGPFADLRIGVAPKDADGVVLAAFDLDADTVAGTTDKHWQVGQGIARYGRMHIDNAYGTELLGMGIKLSAQYWNGSKYVTNTDDNCTPQAFSTFAAADYRAPLTLTNMPFANLTPGAALVAGSGKFALAKPIGGLSGKGSIVIRSGIPYLPGYGRATFGLYKAGPVIFVRETY